VAHFNLALLFAYLHFPLVPYLSNGYLIDEASTIRYPLLSQRG